MCVCVCVHACVGVHVSARCVRAHMCMHINLRNYAPELANVGRQVAQQQLQPVRPGQPAAATAATAPPPPGCCHQAGQAQIFRQVPECQVGQGQQGDGPTQQGHHDTDTGLEDGDAGGAA